MEGQLRASWQAESAFIQTCMFSLLLVTMALTFQHLSHSNSLLLPRNAATVMSMCLAAVAVSFGAVGLYAYSMRASGIAHSGAELHVHRALVVLGVLLLLVESTFVVVTAVEMFRNRAR